MSITPSRPLPAEIRGRLAKLLPMLSSTHAGEQVGAVAAIGRLLRSAGLDWHDLTAAATAVAAAPSPAPAREPPRPQPEGGASAIVGADDLIGLIAGIRSSGIRLGANSEKFLDSLRERAGLHTRVFLSPKQAKWLDDLVRQARKSHK